MTGSSQTFVGTPGMLHLGMRKYSWDLNFALAERGQGLGRQPGEGNGGEGGGSGRGAGIIYRTLNGVDAEGM